MSQWNTATVQQLLFVQCTVQTVDYTDSICSWSTSKFS